MGIDQDGGEGLITNEKISFIFAVGVHRNRRAKETIQAIPRSARPTLPHGPHAAKQSECGGAIAAKFTRGI